MATNNYYQIYVNKVMQLAETIVIKSAESASTINTYIKLHYGPDSVDELHPKTWKYYLNLSGLYHPIDEPMTIVSLDTLLPIKFSIENLKVHRATARGYVYGTRLYQELVTKYPKQEMLIIGILYPVAIDKAIAAKDGAILGYPTGLVEPNEYSLISKLQDWINGYKYRWVNQQYGVSDTLYHATALGIMYLNLVPAIMGFRLEACKTNEAHSFHVRQYLASHGFLDNYMEEMTIKQSLFFYRNIAFIERNAGKAFIFDWLVEHTMTERNLPLDSYSIRHDLKKQPTDIYPTIQFKKKALNLNRIIDPLDTATLEQVLIKEDSKTKGNLDYRLNNIDGIKSTLENSLSNVVATKVLESSVIDYSNSSPYSLEDILVNHWLSLSASDHYTAFVGVINPRTGERIPFTVKEAYVFAWYALCKTSGVVLDKIPYVLAKRVQITNTFKSHQATVADLMAKVDRKLIPVSLAEEMLSIQPIIGEIISTDAFYDTCVSIFNAAQLQRKLVAFQEHRVKRGMAQVMASRIYTDQLCQIADPGESYAAWFSDRNIDISILSNDDLALMYMDVLKEATGLALHTSSSLKRLQDAMVSLLSQLSSYSIQILSTINNTNLKQTDWTTIRVGDVDGSAKTHQYTNTGVIDVIRSYGSAVVRARLKIKAIRVKNNLKIKQKHSAKLKLVVKVSPAKKTTIIHYRTRLLIGVIKPITAPIPNNRGLAVIPGMGEYLTRTTEQQKDIVDIYNGGFTLATPDWDAYYKALARDAYVLPGYSDPGYTKPT
jgi:hypothetical protein